MVSARPDRCHSVLDPESALYDNIVMIDRHLAIMKRHCMKSAL